MTFDDATVTARHGGCVLPITLTGERARIGVLGCPTRNRVEVTRRCIASFAAGRDAHARDYEVVVMDDSPGSATRAAYRAMLAEAASRGVARVCYGGLEEKLAYAKRLITTAGAPADVVKFALFNTVGLDVTTGANRNALLLHAAGEPLVSVDDDTIGEIGRAPGQRPGAVLRRWHHRAASEPLRVVPYATAEDAYAGIEWGPHDVAATHEDALGLAYGGSRAPEGHGCIAATLNSLAGDCTWPSPIVYLTCTDDVIETLAAHEAGFEAACLMRHQVRSVREITVAESIDNAATVFVGLDTRRLLPPFLSVGRGQDILFFVSLAVCIPEARVAHLPWVLKHEPAESRVFSAAQLQHPALGSDLASCIAALLRSTTPTSSDPARRLEDVGTYLQQVANLTPAAFADVLRSVVRRQGECLLDDLELRARDRPVCRRWQELVLACVARSRAVLRQADGWIPRDVLGRDSRHAAALTQQITGAYGALLAWWPTLFEAARTLRAASRALARPIAAAQSHTRDTTEDRHG